METLQGPLAQVSAAAGAAPRRGQRRRRLRHRQLRRGRHQGDKGESKSRRFTQRKLGILSHTA